MESQAQQPLLVPCWTGSREFTRGLTLPELRELFERRLDLFVDLSLLRLRPRSIPISANSLLVLIFD